jgi:hypothetical protein
MFVPSGTSHSGSTSPTRTVTVLVASRTALAATVDGRVVTLQAEVTTDGGSPVGSVELREDGSLVGTAPLDSGVASLRLVGVTPGSHSYTATFVPADPTAYDASASAPLDASVDRTTTVTALTGSLKGSTVTLETTVTGTDGPVPQGLVRILDGATVVGTVQLDSGRATLVLPAVSAGSHTYRANFEESADLAASASPVLDLRVPAPPMASKTTIAAPRSARAGTRPVVKVRVLRGLAAATGKVVLTSGTRNVTLALTNGQVSYRLPKVRRGRLRLSVQYLGNPTTKTSSAGATVTVR